MLTYLAKSEMRFRRLLGSKTYALVEFAQVGFIAGAAACL